MNFILDIIGRPVFGQTRLDSKCLSIIMCQGRKLSYYAVHDNGV